MSTKMLQIGDQFDRYQILGHIAQGGMSDIYRALDVIDQRVVALKIPDRTMIGDPAQYERFQREKEILQTLDHPAVLHGLGCGQYNRIPYLAMDLVEGQSLRDYLRDSAPLPVETALPLFQRIAEGLAYIHANGVVHRDLKPENIFLNSTGQPVIMDFGLALTKGARRVTYANLSATMGTPEYMAPEQVEGKRGDERTDVYSLATILFELLAGKAPFHGEDPLLVMAQRMQQPAPRLDKFAPGIDPRLAAVVAKALKRSPEDRYTTVKALIEAINHLETADLTSLEEEPQLSGSAENNPGRWFQSMIFKSIAISILILVILVVLAVALQAATR